MPLLSLAPDEFPAALAALHLLQDPAEPFSPEPFRPLLAGLRAGLLAPGEALLRPGDAPALECVVIEGLLRSWVGDSEGRAVTLDFHPGPCALTPAIARTDAHGARIHCEALLPTRVLVFEAALLERCMLASPAVQRWGDRILRQELTRRADREWALAALSARERLQQLRRRWPTLEAQVAHHHIASYLGITPVSLSRLRGQLRREA